MFEGDFSTGATLSLAPRLVENEFLPRGSPVMSFAKLLLAHVIGAYDIASWAKSISWGKMVGKTQLPVVVHTQPRNRAAKPTATAALHGGTSHHATRGAREAAGHPDHEAPARPRPHRRPPRARSRRRRRRRRRRHGRLSGRRGRLLFLARL